MTEIWTQSDTAVPMTSFDVDTGTIQGTLKELLTRAYRPFPPPTDTGFTAVNMIAEWLEGRGIQCVRGGVIAVAYMDRGPTLFAFSPALQDEIAARRLYRNIYNSAPETQQFCTRGDERASYNKGCAEKKILKYAREHGATIESMTVREYPDGKVDEALASHVGVGTKDRVYVAPCDSCKAIAEYDGYK